MLLPDIRRFDGMKMLGAALLSFAVLSASACTVRPLYGDAGIAGNQSATAVLSAIEVKPVKTRQALEVRNHLIFLLSGGAGPPASPDLLLDLSVKSVTSSAATVQIAADNEPSAGTVTMTATYTLREVESGEVVSSGRRIIDASFDRLRQEFATYRAEIDAENRAARELAELLRLAIAQDLERRGQQ